MIRVVTIALLVVSPLFLLPGCGGASTATPSTTASSPSAAPDPSLVLKEEPAGAKSVAEVRSQGKDGEEVVVAGWIGGSETPIIQGRAAFTMVDLGLTPLECTTKPYSFCCMSKDALLPNLITVKFVDEEGKTIQKDARELLGIQEGCVVVVRGRLACGEDGKANAIAATGLFNRGYSEDPTKLASLNSGFQKPK